MRVLLFLGVIAALFLFACVDGQGNDDDDEAPSSDDDDDNDDDDNDDDDTDDPSNPFLNPEQPGPYPVGNTSFFFEDSSRSLSCGDGNRVLLTEVWYPAAPEASQWPENYVHDFFLDRWEEVVAAMGGDQSELIDQPTGSFRDAPPAEGAPALPILVFSHGFFSNRFQNFTMATYLASHGYLVVSADHICNAKVTLTPDEIVMGSILNVPLTLTERNGDVRFLIDIFTATPPEPFAGRLDPERVGLWGHSFGALTVTEVFKSEPRADALLQMAAFGFPNVPADVVGPSMYFWGKQDKWMFWSRDWHDRVVTAMPKPKYELEFFETGHFAFSDLCEFVTMLKENGNGCGDEKKIGVDEWFSNPSRDAIHEVLNPYATAFFGAALFDEPALHAYLAQNHRPEMVEYRTHLP